jgi:microcompartment protein CcmL/EutN
MIEPALALLDFSSIATGIQAADAMVKRAQIDTIKAGTVQPGRYLVLIGGTVADVQESLAAGREVGGNAVLDHVFLPQVHPAVVEAIAAAIHAADAGVKGADVRLVELRLADGLGGKGIVLYSGLVANVEAAVEIGVGVLRRPELVVRQVVIPQLHPEMWRAIAEATRFSSLLWERS